MFADFRVVQSCNWRSNGAKMNNIENMDWKFNIHRIYWCRTGEMVKWKWISRKVALWSGRPTGMLQQWSFKQFRLIYMEWYQQCRRFWNSGRSFKRTGYAWRVTTTIRNRNWDRIWSWRRTVMSRNDEKCTLRCTFFIDYILWNVSIINSKSKLLKSLGINLNLSPVADVSTNHSYCFSSYLLHISLNFSITS